MARPPRAMGFDRVALLAYIGWGGVSDVTP